MKDKLGRKQMSTEGYELEVIGYRNDKDMDVRINDEHETVYESVKFWDFKSGAIRNPYHPTVFGVGYLGVKRGQASQLIKGKKLSKKCSNLWRGMLSRCYDPYTMNKYLAYINVTVCNEWHNYKNFTKWFLDNYYEIENENTELDKDILIKGNTTYSPEACAFVPTKINRMFGGGYKGVEGIPLGVCISRNVKDKKYVARYRNALLNDNIHIGYFKTKEEAFYEYKKHREVHIKEVADYYKDSVPMYVYEALYNWNIEMWD